jgi:hypothetical protein
MKALPSPPGPGSAGVWFETSYENRGILYKYRSDTLTPLHSLLRAKEGRAGRATTTCRFARSFPETPEVSGTVIADSPGYEAVMAACRAEWERKTAQSKLEAENQRRAQTF